MPARIQRTRNPGWRAPKGARYVGRGSLYGSPWTVAQTPTGWAVNWTGPSDHPHATTDTTPATDQRAAHTLAVVRYESWIHTRPALVDRVRRELAGRDLMCWCGEPLPCHVDYLLRLANEYCTGDRCEDCTPDEECCEATCGCCPRVNEHDHCFLRRGSEDDSKYCDQHGEGWLFDRSETAQRMYDILRNA